MTTCRTYPDGYPDLYLTNFEKHAVTKHFEFDDWGLEYLVFRKPDTIIGRMEFYCKDNYLIVLGDFGEAVYQWSQTVNLQWIAGCSLDYFAEKCQASETGRNFIRWDRKVAMRHIEEYFLNEARELEPPDAVTDLEIWVEAKVEQLMSELDEDGGLDHLDSSFEWQSWLMNNDVDKYFGSEWQEWAGGIGNCIHDRCAIHLLGLKEAVKKLEEMGLKEEDGR